MVLLKKIETIFNGKLCIEFYKLLKHLFQVKSIQTLTKKSRDSDHKARSSTIILECAKLANLILDSLTYDSWML